MRASHRTWEACQRIAGMGTDEFCGRVRQSLCKRWDYLLARAGRRFDVELAPPSPENRGRFFFSAREVPAILAYLRRYLPEVAPGIMDRAEKICRHDFDLLGYKGVKYGAEIDWHLDAVHAKRAPLRPWYRIPYLDFDLVGDAKVTWELNRHQHLVVLAIAYRLTEDERYAAELFRQWHHWRERNPYPAGINWASSLEVAFRSLSWLWVWHLLDGCPAMPRDFSSDLRRALAVNARHIERNLSTYFSPNTHLLGEAVGLFFIGTLCPGSKTTLRWRDLGWRMVLCEAERQVRQDGMHFEQSIYYHTYALDFFLHARILAACNGVRIPAAFDETLKRMLHVLVALHAAGPLPQIGDDDGGRLFDPARNHLERLLDPVVTGASLFGRADFKLPACPYHPEALWLLGTEGARRFEQLPVGRQVATSFALKSSGLFVMASGGKERQRLLIDAGPQGGGRAVHGHADALSVQLALDGKEFLIDPGTYVYAGGAGERKLFRETPAHNTLVIDGISQAEANGPFVWSSVADARAEAWVTGQSFDYFAGSHNAYARLANPVLHRRSVLYLKPRFWLIRDALEGAGTHQVEICWHFAPGNISCIPGGFRFTGAGRTSLTLLCVGDAELVPRVSRGWCAPCYGLKLSAPVLRVSARVKLPAEFATLVTAEGHATTSLERTSGPLSRRLDTQVQAYRFCSEWETYELFFADTTEPWRTGNCASDARLVYCTTGASGKIVRYAAVHGTFLEIRARRLFTSNLPLVKEEWNLESADPRIRQRGGFAQENGATTLQ